MSRWTPDIHVLMANLAALARQRRKRGVRPRFARDERPGRMDREMQQSARAR